MDVLLLRPEMVTRETLDILCQLSTTRGLTISDAKLIVERQIKNNHFTYVLYIDQIPIGIGSLIISERLIHDGKKVGIIEDVAIHKNYHGQGYGRTLVKRLIKEAKKNKCRKVTLDCSDENILFYEKAAGMHRWHNQMRIDL